MTWAGESSYNKLLDILLQLSTVKDPAKYLPVRLSDGSVFYNAGGLGGAVDVTDRAARLLGIIYGNLDQLQQKPTTKELLAWINNFPTDYFKANQNIGNVANLLNPHPVSLASIPNPSNLDVLLSTRLKIADFVLTQELGKVGIILSTGGVIIDPRSIRALTSADVVSAVKSGTWNIDNLLNPHPVDVSDRAARLLGKIDPASRVTVQYPQGTDIDPRSIRALTSSDIIDVSDRAARLLGAISLGQSSGKTNVLKTGNLVTTATTADQVILTYTVTTGKTFYLEYLSVDCRLTTFATTATWFGAASLESPAGTKLITNDLSGAGAVTRNPYVFSEPIPIASGTVIRVVCTPGATTSYTWKANFGGYEK